MAKANCKKCGREIEFGAESRRVWMPSLHGVGPRNTVAADPKKTYYKTCPTCGHVDGHRAKEAQ